MLDPRQALAAQARQAPAPVSARRRVLVAGAGAALGEAVVEQLLASHAFGRVGVLMQRPIRPALRGLLPVADDDAAWRDFGADTGVIVFDHRRRALGRHDAFVHPTPPELPTLARRLHVAGVRALIVAVPHAPALLPLALQRGLANLDEGAAAALGFEHLSFMRVARDGSGAASPASMLQRLAHWMLRQLNWMVPRSEQPVRTATVARVVARIAADWPEASPGTRVLAPEWLALAAQGGDLHRLVAEWLGGQAPPPQTAPRMRP